MKLHFFFPFAVVLLSLSTLSSFARAKKAGLRRSLQYNFNEDSIGFEEAYSADEDANKNKNESPEQPHGNT